MTVARKNQKKNASVPKNTTKINFNNSIMSSIMMIIMVIVSVVGVTMFVNSRESIKSIQNNLPTDFIQSLYVFNNRNQTAAQFEAELPQLQGKLNQIISKDYTVKDIVVTDEKLEEKFSSLTKGEDVYQYNIAGEPTTFKLIASGRYNVNNYRNNKVKNEGQNINKKCEISNGSFVRFKPINNIKYK